MKSRRITQDKVVYFVNYILLTLLLIVVLYPIIYIISCSFSSGNALMTGKVKLFPVGFTLDSYETVFKYKSIWIGFKNSLTYTVCGRFNQYNPDVVCSISLIQGGFQGKKISDRALFVYHDVFRRINPNLYVNEES